MNTNNNFVSKKLSEINSDANLIISSHLNQLDRISNDIKELEVILQKAAIPFTFIYVLSLEKRKYQDVRYNAPYGEHPYDVKIVENKEHCLVLGKNKDNKCRLSYNIYISNDVIEKCYHESGPYEETHEEKAILNFSKPLIETKSHIRFKTEKELPLFYEEIIKCLQNENTKDLIIEQSPNYSEFISIIGERGIA